MGLTSLCGRKARQRQGEQILEGAMKVRYEPKTDTPIRRLSEHPVMESDEVSPGVFLDDGDQTPSPTNAICRIRNCKVVVSRNVFTSSSYAMSTVCPTSTGQMPFSTAPNQMAS